MTLSEQGRTAVRVGLPGWSPLEADTPLPLLVSIGHVTNCQIEENCCLLGAFYGLSLEQVAADCDVMPRTQSDWTPFIRRTASLFTVTLAICCIRLVNGEQEFPVLLPFLVEILKYSGG